QDKLQPGDMVRGDAVGERVRPAGVFGDVPTDRACLLARGVRREIESRVLGGTGQVQVHHAGLDDGALVFEVELQDAVHSRKDHQDSALPRQRSAREPCAGSAAHERHVETIGESYDLYDVARRAGKHDTVRARLLDRAVVFVEVEILGLPQHAFRAEELFERADDSLVHVLMEARFSSHYNRRLKAESTQPGCAGRRRVISCRRDRASVLLSRAHFEVLMSKPKIYSTHPLFEPARQLLKERFEVQYWDGPERPPRAELLGRVADKEGLICLLTEKINEGLLEAAPKLRI